MELVESSKELWYNELHYIPERSYPLWEHAQKNQPNAFPQDILDLEYCYQRVCNENMRDYIWGLICENDLH